MSKNKAALLVPGAWGGQATPWMSYPTAAAKARGAATHPVTWDPPESLYSQPDTLLGWVREHVEPVLDGVDADASTVIIGKSLGSNAAAIAAERDLPGIWLTPLLTVDRLERALRRTTAPFLLIGGTADASWNGDLARELTPHVCEITGADHGFFRHGEPLARSAAVLADMGTAIEVFLDEVVWPS
ncbi:MAG: alpha/beta hydrolase [Stackebrandtia sp.]